jgi:hypothetical protein
MPNPDGRSSDKRRSATGDRRRAGRLFGVLPTPAALSVLAPPLDLRISRRPAPAP